MKIIILNTLFFLIAITVHAQLTDWQNISNTHGNRPRVYLPRISIK